MIAFAERLSMGFPSVQMSEIVCITYSFTKPKYFAPIEMLYNNLYIGYQYFMISDATRNICKD